MRLHTPQWILVAAVVPAILLGTVITRSLQRPSIRPVDESRLREYAGTYRWDPNAFVYLQMWSELSGSNQLVAFDESGEVRTLYPTEPDRFFAGPGASVPDAVESRIEFRRDAGGKVNALTWSRDGAPARTAQRVDIERHESVRFSNGDVQLAGTLISPTTQGPHPAVILVHALKAGGHPDYTLRILPKANHILLEAKVGNNAEMKSLRRVVPAYSEVVLDWLSKHIAGFGASK